MCIVFTIGHLYETSDHVRSRNIRAHDTWHLASSWALFNGASLRDIFQAARLSSENTFGPFYLRDVAWGKGNFPRASILGTVRIAKD